MTKKLRKPTPTDNKNIDDAVKIIYETIELNTQIEPTLWAAAVFYVLMNGYKNSGFSHDQFKQEMDLAINHYKGFFNETDS